MPPTLPELQNKWFLHFLSDVPASKPWVFLPPVARHAGSQVQAFTNGNTVTPLIDGASYMAAWYASVKALPPNSTLYMADWLLDNVKTLGRQSEPGSGALDALKDARLNGVAVFIALSAHMTEEFLINYQSSSLLAQPNACLDTRFPSAGSNHQKLVCLGHADPTKRKAMLGSVDIATTRWDTSNHSAMDSNRDPGTKPTHDLGVVIQGPAVSDLERSFIERWNDTTSSTGMATATELTTDVLLLIAAEVLTSGAAALATGLVVDQIIGNHPRVKITSTAPAPGVTSKKHSIQVLHTYGRAEKAYSWSRKGEFTIWAAYLNALSSAERYIYIEDQYFLPFGYPAVMYGPAGRVRDSDIVHQLWEAIGRGVRVAVLVPGHSEDWALVAANQKYQRDLGVYRLRAKAGDVHSHGGTGDFVIARLTTAGGASAYVHSKLLICDDEFVLLGSANVCRRSMTHDGEIAVGIVDGDGAFARDLRLALWKEHLRATIKSDWLDAYEQFKTYVNTPANNPLGGPRPYTAGALNPVPRAHERKVNLLMDPYAGPKS